MRSKSLTTVTVTYISILLFAAAHSGYAADSTPQCSFLLVPYKDSAGLSIRDKLDVRKPTVVIVDGYSSGRFLAPRFKERGLQVVHFHSAKKPPMDSFARSFIAGDYDFDISGLDSAREAAEVLRPLENVVAVITGADSGVLAGDQLSLLMHQRFPNVPTNGISLARKDKFLQNEVLHELGIDSAKQIKTTDANTAISWIHSEKLFETGEKMVVIKPLRSGGTDGVFFCHTNDEVHEAITSIMSRPNEYGETNAEVLIQEYLGGDEFVVNTTSRDGHHVITDIWRYQKRLSRDGKRFIYHYDVLLPFEGALQETLIRYTLSVLDALGMRNGNGHTEIKIPPGRGPVLIEMNARMMGAGQPRLTEMATGHSQIDRTLQAYLEPETFKQIQSGYQIQKHPIMITFANFHEGARLNPDVVQKLQEIPGYIRHGFNFSPDTVLSETIDLTSSLGDAWFLLDDEAAVEKAIQEVSRLEQDGSFVIIRKN